MALKDILDKLTEKQAESRVDPLDCDRRVRSFVEGQVRSANEEIPKLELEYKEAAVKHAVIIAVHGSGAEKFGQVSRDTLHTLSIDFYAVAQEIADSVLNRGGSREYNTQEHWLLLNELLNIKSEYGIIQMQPPVIDYQKDGVLLSPTYDAIKLILDKNYGNSLYSAISRVKIGRLALESDGNSGNRPLAILDA